MNLQVVEDRKCGLSCFRPVDVVCVVRQLHRYRLRKLKGERRSDVGNVVFQIYLEACYRLSPSCNKYTRIEVSNLFFKDRTLVLLCTCTMELRNRPVRSLND